MAMLGGSLLHKGLFHIWFLTCIFVQDAKRHERLKGSLRTHVTEIKKQEEATITAKIDNTLSVGQC